MLKLETTVIEILEKSYKSACSSNMILSIVLAVIGIGIIIWLLCSEFEGLLQFIFVVIGAFCLSASLINFMEGSAPYYEITVEVEPTEELTIEKLKNNDNFVEIDNKIYFKTKIGKIFRQSEEDFQNKENIEKLIKNKFEDTVGKIWIKDKIVK